MNPNFSNQPSLNINYDDFANITNILSNERSERTKFVHEPSKFLKDFNIDLPGDSKTIFEYSDNVNYSYDCKPTCTLVLVCLAAVALGAALWVGLVVLVVAGAGAAVAAGCELYVLPCDDDYGNGDGDGFYKIDGHGW